MWFYTLLNVVITILVVIAVLYLAFRFYVVRQGDEHIQMVTKRRSAFQLEDISFDKVTLVCDIPLTNRGKQNGTIMDLYPRHLLPQEQFDNVHVECWTMDVARPRHDGYFESYIVEPKKGGTIRLHVIMTGKNGNIRKDLQGFPDMNIDIVYQVVGRTDWHISKNRICLTSEELQAALGQ